MKTSWRVRRQDICGDTGKDHDKCSRTGQTGEREFHVPQNQWRTLDYPASILPNSFLTKLQFCSGTSSHHGATSLRESWHHSPRRSGRGLGDLEWCQPLTGGWLRSGSAPSSGQWVVKGSLLRRGALSKVSSSPHLYLVRSGCGARTPCSHLTHYPAWGWSQCMKESRARRWKDLGLYRNCWVLEANTFSRPC